MIHKLKHLILPIALSVSISPTFGTGFFTLEEHHYLDSNGNLKPNAEHLKFYADLGYGDWNSLSIEDQTTQIDHMVNYSLKLASLAMEHPEKSLYFFLAGCWVKNAACYSKNETYHLQANLYLHYAIDCESNYNENRYNFFAQMTALKELEQWTKDIDKKRDYLDNLIEKVNVVLDAHKAYNSLKGGNSLIPAPKSINISSHYSAQNDCYKTMFTDLAYHTIYQTKELQVYPEQVLYSIINYKNRLSE